MGHTFLTVLVAASAILVAAVSAQNNRAKMCTKAVKLGVTFYTAGELQPILSCAEKAFYENPNDTENIVSKGKTCVINNSMGKALQALSLYNGFNGCTNIAALMEKLTQPFLNQSKPVVNLAIKTLNNCKKNNKKTGAAKQNACMNQVYGKCMAGITKAFVNKVCTGLAKKMNKAEWNCAKKYLPKVVNVKGYKCYSITK